MDEKTGGPARAPHVHQFTLDTLCSCGVKMSEIFREWCVYIVWETIQALGPKVRAGKKMAEALTYAKAEMEYSGSHKPHDGHEPKNYRAVCEALEAWEKAKEGKP
jgi:hypothetical protein